MKKLLFFILTLSAFSAAYANPIYATKPIKGLLSPESAIQSDNGDIYVSEINEFDKDGDGQITKIDILGKTKVVATGMNDPKGLAIIAGHLYVADKTRILKVAKDGNWTVFAAASAFPTMPQFLNDLTTDNYGNLYVSDSGNLSAGGAIYKINKAGQVSTIVDSSKAEVLAPNGLLFEGRNNLLSVDFSSGILYRINIGTGKMTKLAEGFGGGDGIIKSKKGKVYVSDWKNGYIYSPGAGIARIIKSDLYNPADIALSVDGQYMLVPSMKTGTLEFISIK